MNNSPLIRSRLHYSIMLKLTEVVTGEVMQMERDKIFYANAIQISVSTEEAALIFGIRPIEEMTPGTNVQDVEVIEVARVHLPKSLLDRMIDDYVQARSSMPAQESYDKDKEQ